MVALPNRALAGLAAAAGLATVQALISQGDCDPIETDCAPFPAISAKVHCDLTTDDCEHVGTLEGRGVEVQNYDSPDGAEFTVESLGADDYLSIQTSLEYLLFGRVDVEIRTTPATGLETFLGLGDFFSSTVDISFRLRGAYKDEASLYFFANTDNFTDTKTIPDMTADFHTYSINWTPDSVSWLVDDEQIWFVDRKPSSEDGKTYIERPLKVFMGIQISGRDGAGDAAISLVGGEADMAEAPFTSYFRNLTITDYGGGSNATKAKIKEYEATDNSGDIDSIKIVKEGDSSSKDDSKGDDGTGDDSKGDATKGDTKPIEEASSSKSGGISRATAVGIAFGVFSLLVICGIAGYIFYHRRKMAQPRSSDTQPFMATTVNNHHEDPWIMGYHAPLEMDGTDRPQELDVRKDMAPVELAVPPRQLRD